MPTGQSPQMTTLFVGVADGTPADVIEKVSDELPDITIETIDSLDLSPDTIDEHRYDAFIYGGNILAEDGIDCLEPFLEEAGDRPHIIIVTDASQSITEPSLQAGVTEVLNIDTLEDPVSMISNRIKFNIGKHRQEQRHQALWYQVRQLINQAEDLVWMFTPDWDEVLFANTAFERIWGQSLEELYARPQSFLDGIHPTDRPKVRRAMDRLSAGEEIELEYRVNRSEDYERWVWVLGYPITDDDGEMIAVSGFCRDISERKLQEEQHRSQRDRFHRLFQHFPEPTLAYRFDGDAPIIEAVNTAFEEVFGYAEDDILGRVVDDVVAPDELMDEAEQIDERVQAGEFVDEEVRRKTANGEQYFRFRNIELPEDDEFDGFGIYADIHDRKERERTLNSLHETTRELAQTWERPAIAMIATEAVEDIIDMPWSGMWLYDEDESDLVPAHTTTALEDLLEGPSLMASEHPLLESLETVEELHFDDTHDIDDWPEPFAPLRSASLVPLGDHGFLLIGSTEVGGISEEHRTFTQILAANTVAAIDRADREVALREQRRELQRQNERLEEFTSVVSHDLRTPLAVATAATEQLGYEHENVDVSQIENALERMDTIISRTLTLAKSGQVTGEMEPVDLGELARRCLHTVSTSAINLEIGEDLPTITADPDRLQHIFENLYRNAVEHAGPEVTISVEATADGFAVADDGPGIPSDEADRIFETGYSTTADGTGFGLAIVKRIAESHGWTIHVEESDAGGARFRFSGVSS